MLWLSDVKTDPLKMLYLTSEQLPRLPSNQSTSWTLKFILHHRFALKITNMLTSTSIYVPNQQHQVNVFRNDKVLILLSNPLEFANTKDELIAAAEETRLSLLLL